MNGRVIAGLTGQSGAGKTTVSEVFRQQGFYVINCDETSRKAVEPNSECAMELERLFPQFFENGILNRKKAGAALFSDSELLQRYNAAIFPHIIRLIKSEIDSAVKNGERFILLDAPTLFEAGADRLCEFVVSCTADVDIRAERIVRRDGIPAQAALARFSAQHSEEFFCKNSDFLIENNGTQQSAQNTARKIAEKIKEHINDEKK